MKRQRYVVASTILATGLLALGQSAAWAQNAPGQKTDDSNAPTETATASPTPTPVPLKDGDPIAKINDETITVEQMVALVVLRPVPKEPVRPLEQVPIMRGEQLERFSRNAGAFDLIAEDAKKAGTKLEDREIKSAADLMKNWNHYLVMKTAINSKLTEPTKEELDKLYEARKETDFRVKESMKIRQIFVSTYVDYTVKAGDTLESIAKEVGGDESVANLILDDETKRPRSEKKPAASADGKDEKATDAATLDPRALQEGEKLKVPVRGDKEKAAQGKIDAAYERLQKGETFEVVAKDISENENPGQLFEVGPELNDRPLMPELQKAFLEIKDHEYSKPVRTKHGFQIVYRESYTPKSYTEREKADPTLIYSAKNEQMNNLSKEFVTNGLKDEEVVKVDMNALKTVADEGKDKDTILTIGDKPFSLSSFYEDTQNAIKEAKDGPKEDFLAAIAKDPATFPAIEEAYGKKNKFDEMPLTKFVSEKENNTLLAVKYMTAMADDKTKELSDEEVQKWYDENKAQFLEPQSYTLYKIDSSTLSADDLKKAVAGIQNLEDFKTKANELNAKGANQDGGSLGPVPVNKLSKDDVAAIGKVTVPGMTDVLAAGTMQRVYWVQESKAERTVPLEEKRSNVENYLKGQKKTKIVADLQAEYKAKVKFEPLVKE